MRRSSPRCIGGFLALATALLGQPFLVPAHAAAAPVSNAASSAKGPVGWDAYRHLDRLPGLTTGVQTEQFSSFDRGGANGDFGSPLAHAADGYVLAEHQGPGEINSIWSTRDGGDVRATGNMHITVDDTTVLNAPLQDVVNGKLGAPFVFPLVGNADQSSGGVYLGVPMPFQRSMRITTDADPVYYHVTTRTFADASGVPTFDPADRAQDVLAQFTAAGTRDPKPAEPGATATRSSIALAPGQTAQLGTLAGPGTISTLQLHLPQLLAPLAPAYLADDGRAFGRNSGAHSEFTVATDPRNDGVRLTRRLNPDVGNQRADISVDGVKVAAWAPLPAQAGGVWQDQSVDLPASATAGKSQITVRNVFVSTSNDFNEYGYWSDSIVDGQPQRTDTVDVGSQHTQSEAAHHYTIAQQTNAGSRVAYYPPTAEEQAEVLASDDVLQGARLRITFDGQRTVDAPIGEFFGSGLQLSPVRALMYAMDPATQTLSSWWSMPYARNATVELYNGSQHAISSGDSSITSSADQQVTAELGPTGNLGYFRATSNHAPTTPGQGYVFLKAGEWGKFVGVTHTMVGPPTRGYLEGDERAYVDGSRTPQINGTGTEDFYQGGWYFNRDTFSDPTHGNPTHEAGTAACPTDCTGVYRQMITDAVPFHSSLSFGIEHGPVDDVQANYSSTAYWYGRSTVVQRTTDTLDVGDVASELAHHYGTAGAAPVTTVTSTYEGNDGVPAPVASTARAATDPVQFTLGLDTANAGLLLRRTSDQRLPGQSAEVYVDGQDAGTWRQPLGNSFHRWLDDSFFLPQELTTGKAQITVRLVPSPGAPAFSAARVEALNTVAPFADNQPPSPVTGLRAQSGWNNVTTLSWQPATDNVGVDHYTVYGSTDSAFSDTPATLLGTAQVGSFTHSGLGLWQSWHYRVVAVDAAGNVGNPSAEASATTGVIPTAATTTTVGAPTSPAAGVPIPLFATVAPVPVLGTVAFFDGGKPIPGCVARPVVLASYAVCATVFIHPGVHPITAVYGGDLLQTSSTGYAAVNVSADHDTFQLAVAALTLFLRAQHLFGL